VRHSGFPVAQILDLFLGLFPAIFVFTVPGHVIRLCWLWLGADVGGQRNNAMTALGIGRPPHLLPVAVALTGRGGNGGHDPCWDRGAEDVSHEQADLITCRFRLHCRRAVRERSPKLLHVQRVSAAARKLAGVFLAQTGSEIGSQLTLARTPLSLPNRNKGKVEWHLKGGHITHEFSRV